MPVTDYLSRMRYILNVNKRVIKSSQSFLKLDATTPPL